MDEDRKPAEPESMAEAATELQQRWHDACMELADQLCGIVRGILDILRSFGIVEALTATGHLTPRQFYLCGHGKTRTRKKWANAARHKAELAQKRGGKNNG